MKRDSGIRYYVLILALAPAITIAILLGTAFTLTRLTNLDYQLHERSITTTAHLSTTVAYGIQLGDTTLLQKIARTALEKNDARSVNIFAKNGERIARAGPRMLTQHRELPDELQIYEGDTSLRVIAPLYSHDEPLRTHSSAAAKRFTQSYSNRIGWLEMEFSKAHTRMYQYQTLLASGLLILTSILLTLLFARRMARRITNPIQNMIEKVEQIGQGALDVRIETHTAGELQELQTSINNMAIALQQEQAELQQNIEQSTADLHETLETIEIQNIELDMARKEALEASRIKSEFLANISHEIRTPLNGIIGFTNLLLKSRLNDHQRDYLATIRTSSEGLLTILNDVLDFSKIEAGKLELDSSPLNLREVIEEALAILAPAAHEKSLELVSLVYSDTPQNLLGDALRLKQIITNLVNNAIKFTTDGSIVVRAMLEELKESDIKIKITVTDTGIGLTEEQQKSLFHAFAQADTSRNRKIGGTGLGLAISKRLASQMGGEIGVESERGNGSTFWFTFSAGLASKSLLPPPPLQLGEYHALYYERHELARQSGCHLLTETGLKFDEVGSLQQLEQVLATQSERYQLLILSHHPHELDASQIDALRQRLPDLYLLVLTTTEHELRLNQLLAPYPNAICLVKPVSQQRLFRALSHLFFTSKEHPLAHTSHHINQALTRPPKILAVDDNSANLKLLKALLEQLGAEVSPVSGGHEAIAATRGQHFDLIFMDVQMPEIDGLEATRQIRELELGDQRTPIIALTAHALAEEKTQLIQAGMDDYMTKPISEGQLRHVIEKWTGLQLLPTPLPNQQHAPELEPPAPVPEKKNGSLPIVDMAQGIKLAGGKQALAEDMLDMLLSGLPADQEQIKMLWQQRNWQPLLDNVHKLHGATRYCGVPLLREACQEAEEQLKMVLHQGHGAESLEPVMTELITQLDSLMSWKAQQKTQDDINPTQE